VTKLLRALPVLLLAAGAAGAPPVRVLILTGESDRPYHDWRSTTPFLKGILEASGRFDVKVAEEPRGLTGRTLSGYDALVLNYNGPRWGGQSERAVEEFIRSGKGMVAVHGVSYGVFFGMEWNGRRWTRSQKGDKGWEAYADLLGATWASENIGHAARHVFPVKWKDREHPISRGLEPEFLANDELYHRLDLRPNARVLAAAFDDPAVGGTGKEEPILWTVPFGAGRAVHITLGHDIAAMYQPGFAAAFARSLEWTATGAVTLPARVNAVPVPQASAVRVLVVTGGHGYPSSFFTLFEGHAGITWRHASSQTEAFTPDMAERYDVLVLHDMHETIGEAARENLRAFVESGKGVVSTHHAIVDYTSWPWWHEEVIGGKYFTAAKGPHPASAYKDDVEMVARPAKGMTGHPVIRGLGPLPVVDEAYRGMWHSPRITVLMETAHPLNDRPVVYIGPHPKARAVYIQYGHNDSTIRHPGYRALLRNAVLWTARRIP
jgi:type 1 glutamine amidotransferase